MLVCASRTPVTVTALRSEQNGGNVVDLMCGLGTCTLLGDTATLAPSMAGIQHKGEKEDKEEECYEASLDKSKTKEKKTEYQEGTQRQLLMRANSENRRYFTGNQL